MTSRLSGRILTVSVRFEPLLPGPVGRLVRVVDYDPVRTCWYEAVDLDDGEILAQDGLPPSEDDPRSHQQIVYAVASSVVERVERFLGRRFRWRGDSRLTLVPHAFASRNAYFDPGRGAVLFGYYRADEVNPGANLPGQLMFTCLSNDIVAHEVTHAIVHRIRRRYLIPTNPDVLAIHEGLADLVALFHHFVHPEVVFEAIAKSSGKIDQGTGLFDLALEFGEATGRGAALRSGLDAARDPEGLRTASSAKQYAESKDPHKRAANFVIAVFDAFLTSYRESIADLLRIATGGTGVLPAGRLHPDLVARATREAITTADRVLGMVIRGLEYLPVCDVTFGDVVRAVVTADAELFPDDDRRLRATLVEAFRRRGIFPKDVRSLSDASLRWPKPDPPLSFTTHVGQGLLAELVRSSTSDLDVSLAEFNWSDEGEPDEPTRDSDDQAGENPLGAEVAIAFSRWARAHADQLGLRRDMGVAVAGVHVSYRQAADAQPRPELVLQLEQRRRDLEDESLPLSRRVPLWAGTCVIASIEGDVRFVIAKPLPERRLPNSDFGNPRARVAGGSAGSGPVDPQRSGEDRLAAIHLWSMTADEDDPASLWLPEPALTRLTFASMHDDAYDDDEVVTP